MTDIVTVGVAGLGDHFFENLAPALANLPNVVVRCALTRDTAKGERVKALFRGCDIFGDQASLVAKESELDAVLCAGPPAFNREIVAGLGSLYAFLEKPVPRDYTQLENREQKIQVGFNLVFSWGYRKLLEVIEQQGGMLSVSISYRTNKPRTKIWDCPDVASSLLAAIGCHPIHLALTMGFGELLYHRWTTGDGAGYSLTAIFSDVSGRECRLHVDNRTRSASVNIRVHCVNGEVVTLNNLRELVYDGISKDVSNMTTEQRKEVKVFRPSLFSDTNDFTGFRSELASFFGMTAAQKPVESHVNLASGRAVNAILDSLAP